VPLADPVGAGRIDPARGELADVGGEAVEIDRPGGPTRGGQRLERRSVDAVVGVQAPPVALQAVLALAIVVSGLAAPLPLVDSAGEEPLATRVGPLGEDVRGVLPADEVLQGPPFGPGGKEVAPVG
jgi:hypothetical protein